MPRLLPAPTLATIVLLSSTPALADVVVVPRSDDSNQVIVKTAPPTVVVVKQKAPTPPPPPPERERKAGIHFEVGGAVGSQVSLGGFGGALRFRPNKHIGIDLGSGYYAGTDYQGFYRSEIPLTANVLFFLNPQHKFQFYFLLGPGASFARVERPGEIRRMSYIGGSGGFGLEWRIAKAFALNTDIRGVIRHRVDNDPRPEFFDGTRSSDTSYGALFTFGGTFYF